MTQPDVRVRVQDFGPIVEAAVDLRPLTVFVGPSNTGKTYLATLIYALHRVSEGFGRMPPRADLATERFRWMDSEIVDQLNGEAREKILKVGTEFTSGDLPEQVREEFPSMLGPVVGQLEAELERCFDVESCSELIRVEGSGGSLRVSLDVREAERSLWHVRMDVSRQPESSGEGEINDDVVLLPAETSPAERMDLALKHLRAPGALFEALMEHARWTGQAPRARHLPAARSGMVQSHRVIASSLVARSTRAGSKRAAELPTMSSVMADFMECLILYDEGKSRKREILDLADALEHDPLFGEIRARRSLPGGFPEFVYRPRGTTQDIRFSRASSMVTEIAPIVLFLRGIVDPGDTLIIEELEAHLHPAAQTRMAVTLARLVRAGVRVVVTTHSDWLLKALGNLMRQGELVGEPAEPAGAGTTASWLKPHEVGVWLFSRRGDGAGSTVQEIPFDHTEGIEPEEYEDVAEALYNRSAELQNRLLEAAEKHGASGDE